MRIKNTTTGNIIIADLPGYQLGAGLSVPADVEVLIFNEDAEKSIQLRSFLTAGTILNLGPEEPSTGFPEADAQPSIVGPVQILIVDIPNPGEVLTATSGNTAEWQPGGGGGGADASTTVKGITKLSVAPAVPSNPIAAGDNDPRMTNARALAGALAGDVTGGQGATVVEKVNGVAVSGAPSAGQVITATGPAAATWQTPAGGTVTGTGTAGKIALWSNGTAISDSVISEDSGKIGIGVALPSEKLDIDGAILVRSTAGFSGIVASSGGLDHTGTDLRILARGQDAFTNGGFQFISTRGDGSNVLFPLLVLPSGVSVAGSVKIVDGSQAAGKVLTSDVDGIGSWQTPTGGPATALATTGADVVVNTATPPTTGQVLTATSPTAADWQTPSGGGSNPYAGTGSFVKTNTWHLDDGAPNYSPSSSEILAHDGTNLWIVDNNSGVLKKMNTDAVVLSSYPSIANVTDLIFAFGYLWAVNGGTSLMKIDASNGTVVATYTSGRMMRYLTFNASYIFTSSSGGDMVIYKFDPVTNQFHNGFDQAESSQPDSMVTDGGSNFWIIDQSSATIRRVNRDPVYASLGVFNISFVAKQEGTAGNAITIKFEFKGAGLPDVAVTGNDIVITVFNSTGEAREFQIANAVNNHVTASTLIRATAGSPNSIHNYNQAPYNTAQNMVGGIDHTLGTIDVSASGLPVAGNVSLGYLWVTMNNGDLLKIDAAADSVLATFPSGASALGGITSDNAQFLHVTETAPSDKIRTFDFNLEYYVDTLPTGNNPDDIVWDYGTAENIWSIDRASSTIRRLHRRTGALLGTIDVSASGTPRRGVFASSLLWVCMSNGDLLKINPATDAVDNTYPSGQTELMGITAGNGSTLYVSDPVAKFIIPFDTNAFTFGAALDLTLVNVPNDIAWDQGGQLWSLDFTSTTIKRLDTSGNVLSDVVVTADGGLPKRMAPILTYGSLWVSMTSGNLLRCDPYGTGNIQETFVIDAAFSGISSDGSSNFFLSAAGATDRFARFFHDNAGFSSFYHHIIEPKSLQNPADRIKISGPWLFSLDLGDSNVRKVSPQDGSTLDTISTVSEGSPMDLMALGSFLYITTSNGKVMKLNYGLQQATASLVIQDLTFVSNSPGSGGNTFNVEYTNGNTLGQATVTVYDGTRLVVDIEGGVTNAQTMFDAILATTGNGSFTTTITGSASNAQTAPVAQTFFTGGGDVAPSLVLPSVVSGKTALGGITENLNWPIGSAGPAVGYAAPADGYLRMIDGGGFFATGLAVFNTPDRMTASTTDLWVCSSNGPDAPFRVDIATMSVVAQITGAFGNNNGANGAALLGGYVYMGDNNFPIVYRINPATNAVDLRINTGDASGGNNYAWIHGIYSDGASLWVTTTVGSQFASFMTMEKIVSGRVVAAVYGMDGDTGNNFHPMVRLGDALFVCMNRSVHRLNVNLG